MGDIVFVGVVLSIDFIWDDRIYVYGYVFGGCFRIIDFIVEGLVFWVVV